MDIRSNDISEWNYKIVFANIWVCHRHDCLFCPSFTLLARILANANVICFSCRWSDQTELFHFDCVQWFLFNALLKIRSMTVWCFGPFKLCGFFFAWSSWPPINDAKQKWKTRNRHSIDNWLNLTIFAIRVKLVARCAFSLRGFDSVWQHIDR